jgi:hypothetical protein
MTDRCSAITMARFPVAIMADLTHGGAPAANHFYAERLAW